MDFFWVIKLADNDAYEETGGLLYALGIAAYFKYKFFIRNLKSKL